MTAHEGGPAGAAELRLDFGFTRLSVEAAVMANGTLLPAPLSRRSELRDSRAGGSCDVTVEYDVQQRPEGVFLDVSVHGGDAGLILQRFDIRIAPFGAVLLRDPSALRIAYCGAHSRSQLSRSRVESLTEAIEGWWVGAVRWNEELYAAAGSVDFQRFCASVLMEQSGLTVRQHLEGYRLRPHEPLDAGRFWISATQHPPLPELEAYAEMVGRHHHATPGAPVSGWGSWGEFVERIDASLIRESLAGIEGSPGLRSALDVIQIDDGWSEVLDTRRVSTSWLPNRRFPSGIAPLASAITATGRNCGIWFLPFTVNEGSALASERPEFLVADESGEPKRVGDGESYCLDPTHPGAAAWLADRLAILREWGITYTKLDHLRVLLAPEPYSAEDGLQSPRSYRGARTRTQAYRHGLAVLRQQLGPEVRIVGCSAPLGPCAGLVDAQRIGPDIAPQWEADVSGIRDASRALAANFFWQGRAWHNDPDYLLAGADDGETIFWATAVALSGGSTILSADLGDLSAREEWVFAMVTPPTGVAARPLDLFERPEGPRIWHLRLEHNGNTRHLLGLFNWGDRGEYVSARLSELGVHEPAHAWDVWRQRHHTINESSRWYVAARSARLIAVRAVATHPQVVGSSIHFSQGHLDLDAETWDHDARRLVVRRSQLERPGALYVWSPAGAPAALELAVNGTCSSAGTIHALEIAAGQTAHVPSRGDSATVSA